MVDIAKRVVAGQTLLSETVVESIAGVAAREVKGVHKLGRGTLRNAIARVRGASEAQGVDAEVGAREVAIDLEMVVEYGFNIQDVATQVRAVIAERIEQMTSRIVKEVNINVVDIHFPDDKKDEPKRRVE